MSLTVALFLWGGVVPAAVIRVPADQPTIQAAVDAAVSGDTIVLSAGTYSGAGNHDVTVEDKQLIVTGEGSPESTIVDCQGAARAFFVVRSDDTTRLELRKLQLANGSIAGIELSVDTRASLEDVMITNNEVGIRSLGNVRVELLRCRILQNRRQGILMGVLDPRLSATDTIVQCNGLDGITLEGGGRSDLLRVRVLENGGRGMSLCQNSAFLDDCTISRNRAEGLSAVLSGAVLRRCVVSLNSASGLLLSELSHLELTNSLVARNGASGVLGERNAPSTVVRFSTIAANEGFGINLSAAVRPRVLNLHNSIVWGNQTGGLLLSAELQRTVAHSCVQGLQVFPGVGNSNRDPLFADSSSFGLRWNSPYIDVAVDGMPPESDLLGTLRPCRRGFDLGAVEYCPVRFSVTTEAQTILVLLYNDVPVRAGTVCIAYDASLFSASVDDIVPGFDLPQEAELFKSCDVFDVAGVPVTGACIVGWLNGSPTDFGQAPILEPTQQGYELLRIHLRAATQFPVGSCLPCVPVRFLSSFRPSPAAPIQQNIATDTEGNSLLAATIDGEICSWAVECEPCELNLHDGLDNDCDGSIDASDIGCDRVFVPGDCTRDGVVDVGDPICLLGFLFLHDPAELPCLEPTEIRPGLPHVFDWNDDRAVNLTDGIYALSWLFRGGSPHALGTDCETFLDCEGPCLRQGGL